MSGLALLLMKLGHAVSGSDRVTTEETERMEGGGLRFACGHAAEHVDGCDMVIYSSAIRPGNPEYDRASQLGIPLVRRAEALAALFNGRKGIVVAGTHGKTTTSALLAHVLRRGGKHPSHYVGAEIPVLGSNAFWDDEGSLFVAEGDESDGSIVCFKPLNSIILNIEADHLDYFSGIEEIRAVFLQVVNQTRGEVIYCAEDLVATEVAACAAQSIGYGWDSARDEVAAEIVERGAASTRFAVFFRGDRLGEITLGIPGDHNVLNALAAFAAAHLHGVGFLEIGAAMKSFRGARRRFETKFHGEQWTVVDDYGHHPTEVRATLAAARQLGRQRTLCVFQPHRYTRTQLLKDAFGRSFADADRVFVTDVYPASEKPLPGVGGHTVVEAIAAHGGPSAVSVPALAAARLAAGNALRDGDLLVTLGAGNVHEVGTAIAADLAVLAAIREAAEDSAGVFRLYEPLARHTTLRVGGPAQFWIEPTTAASMQRVVAYLRCHAIAVRVIGRGSNLLVRDGGIAGAVIHPARGEFCELQVEGDTITAGAGVRLKKVAAVAQRAGIGGFEWMEGIPGNVGGAVRMNAGAMGVETFDQVVAVRFIDTRGELCEKPLAEIEYHYRSVPEFQEHFVTSVVFRGEAGADPAEIESGLEASRAKRKGSQPVAASAGCTFKNPAPEVPAGELIDQLGLKGHKVGRASVSAVHGNFITNDGKALASDVLNIIKDVTNAAFAEKKINLETEVQILGEDTVAF
jgi:UDP-N-acetylmuramate--L-alanine ligase/UDP-N-acetylenolpyruvoylglucosamine reductase